MKRKIYALFIAVLAAILFMAMLILVNAIVVGLLSAIVFLFEPESSHLFFRWGVIFLTALEAIPVLIMTCKQYKEEVNSTDGT